MDVSGYTFTAYFTCIYSLLFLVNLFRDTRTTHVLSFWVQGLPYYTYLLFCLTTYRNKREICWYDWYGMCAGFLHLLVGLLTLHGGGIPWVFFSVCAIILFFVILGR